MKQIQNLEEFNQIKTGIIDFYADWCRPCWAIKPLLVEIQQEKGYDMYTLDVDNFPELALKHEVRSIPTLMVLKDGEEVGRLTGVNPKVVIESYIDGRLAER